MFYNHIYSYSFITAPAINDGYDPPLKNFFIFSASFLSCLASIFCSRYFLLLIIISLVLQCSATVFSLGLLLSVLDYLPALMNVWHRPFWTPFPQPAVSVTMLFQAAVPLTTKPSGCISWRCRFSCW